MRNELPMYRVYGETLMGQVFDDYCQASTAQKAVDEVRGWRASELDEYRVIEVSKVLKGGWK